MSPEHINNTTKSKKNQDAISRFNTEVQKVHAYNPQGVLSRPFLPEECFQVTIGNK